MSNQNSANSSRTSSLDSLPDSLNDENQHNYYRSLPIKAALKTKNMFGDENFNEEPLQLLILDTEIPDLDPDDAPYLSDIEQDGPHVTIKSQNIEKLNKLCDMYLSFKGTIEANEATSAPPKSRSPTQTNTITSLRKRLYQVYMQIQPLVTKIAHIKNVQQTLRPTLPLPARIYDDDDDYEINYKELTDFCGQSVKIKEQEHRLIETWTKLLQYATLKKMGHDTFKAAIMCLLHSEHFDYIRNFPDAKLPKIASLLAARFITESKFNDAVTDLDNFTRAPNESLRIALARLRTSLEKASIIWPANERETIKEIELRKTIRQIISPTAKSKIDKYSIEARQQGITLSIDHMIRIAEDDEKITGPHDTSRPHPISLYNITTETSKAQDSKIDNLSEKVDKLADVSDKMIDIFNQMILHPVETDEQAQCYPAIRSARFENKAQARPYATPTGLSPRPATPFPSSADIDMANLLRKASSFTPAQAPQPTPPRDRARSDSRSSQRNSRDDRFSRNRSLDRRPESTSSYDRSRPTARAPEHNNSIPTQQSATPVSNYSNIDSRSRDALPSQYSYSNGQRDRSSSYSRNQNSYSKDRYVPRDRSHSQSQRNRQSSRDYQYNRDQQDYRRDQHDYRRDQQDYKRDQQDYRSRVRDQQYRQRDYSRGRNPQNNQPWINKDDWRESGRPHWDPSHPEYPRSASRNRYNSTQQRYPHNSNMHHMPIVNAQNDATVNVRMPIEVCQFCASPAKHTPKECYVIKAAYESEN